jgi:hypothetical protein
MNTRSADSQVPHAMLSRVPLGIVGNSEAIPQAT